MTRGLGRIPNKHKPGYEAHKEPRFATARPIALPRDFDGRNHVVKQIDQLQTSTCVSNQMALCHRAAWHYRGIDRPLPSRLHNYWHARRFTGDELADGGTYIHSGVNALIKFGAPPETSWPFSEDQAVINRRPDFSAEVDGEDWSGPERYYLIGSTGDALIEDIQTAIYVHQAPVVFGTLVSRAFTMLDTGEHVVDVPQPGDPIAGGHAMSWHGWQTLDSGEVLLLTHTSWGEFGEHGFFWMKSRYAQWSETDDINALELAAS